MQSSAGRREPAGLTRNGPASVPDASRPDAVPSGGAPPGAPGGPPPGAPGGPPPAAPGGAASGAAAPEPASRITRTAWYGRLAPHLHRARSTPTGAIAVRVAVTLFGTAVIITGIVLLPLPGPGWLIIFVGLAILSLEYVWARHLLRYTMRQVRRWEAWVRACSPGVRIAIGILTVALLVALAAVTVELSFGRGTLAGWWHAVAP